MVLGVSPESVVVRERSHGRNVWSGALPLTLDLFAHVPGLEVVYDADVVLAIIPASDLALIGEFDPTGDTATGLLASERYATKSLGPSTRLTISIALPQRTDIPQC